MRTQIFNFARTITQTKNCDWLSIWTFPLSLCSHCRRFYLSVFPSLVLARIPLVRFACFLHCLIDEFCSVTILQFHNYASKTQCSRVDFAVKVAHTVKTRGSSCYHCYGRVETWKESFCSEANDEAPLKQTQFYLLQLLQYFVNYLFLLLFCISVYTLERFERGNILTNVNWDNFSFE